MFYPEIDETGEHIADRNGSNYELMLRDVAPGNSLLIDMPPAVPSWWDGGQWVAKPAQPSQRHVWDRAAKVWRDPRTAAEVEAELLAEVRRVRDAALLASDVEALRSLEMFLPESLRVRRQALRDAPAAPDPVAALAAITGETIANS